MPRLPDDTLHHVRAFARDVRVTAIFTGVAEANHYMEDNANEGVIAEAAGLIFVADVNDLGSRDEIR